MTTASPDEASLDRVSLDQALLGALASGTPVSGAQLAQCLGVTRAALWKHVADLRASGLPIEARTRVGYCLPWPIQLLDVDVIAQALGPLPQAPVHVCWQLDSTQDELARHQGERPDLSVVLCERQTGGRGRRGRAWLVPPALNICLSCLKRFPGGPATLSGLSIAVGVCVVRALSQLGILGLRLKWPNDVVVDAGKLCGILIEVNGEAEGPCVARIGIGLNIRLPAQLRNALNQPAADLAQLCEGGVPPDRNVVAASLIRALRDGLLRFEEDGLDPFLEEFAALDSLRGKTLQIDAPRGVQQGIARGINEVGALLVEADGKIAPLYSGEVSVRVSATER
ncbi:MAG TPA: biotin--[acetyl-CoA-carboxylase] ligase [Castellaniella sp.]|uniref:biotin--[acetyl-CoA-carboxylase] ligase n=1 Tax=Castellaniella sp. TaxID=1955812 RepID=UPI002EFF97D7